MQYLGFIMKAIPENIENIKAYFNTALGAFNVFSSLKQRFSNEKAEIQDAKDFQNKDPNLYSCLFQGSLQLEYKKRQSFAQKQVCFERILKFVGGFNFDQTLLSSEIKERFYSKQLGCCLFNLEEIQNQMNVFFSKNINQQEKEKALNDSIEDISLMLLEYVKGQYKNEDNFEEFVVSFAEIQEFVYSTILQQVSKSQQNTYQPIISKLEAYTTSFQQKQRNDQILKYLEQLAHHFISLKEVKKMVKMFYQDEIDIFNDHVKQVFQYKLTHTLLVKYHKKIQKEFIQLIQDRFQILTQLDNQIIQSKMQEKIEQMFHQYLSFHEFGGGIIEQDINRQLQYLIYSINWIQAPEAADQAMEFLNGLTEYHVNVYLYESQQIFNELEFSVDILNNFRYVNKKRCKDAKLWWDKNISEEQNLLIIFQIFVIISKIQFKGHNLFVGTYSPADRLALIQILRKLNNGKYNYSNIAILKICEKIVFSISQQIYQSIQHRLQIQKHQSFKSLLDSSLEINFQGMSTEVYLYFDRQKNENHQQVTIKFFENNKLFNTILKSVNSNLLNTQFSVIKEKLKQIENHNSQIAKSIDPPNNLMFEIISRTDENSNVITLVIPGLISGDDDKIQSWKGFLQPGSGTVVAMHWNCAKLRELFGLNKLGQLYSTWDLIGLVNGVSKGINYILNENSYLQTHQEAIKVGRYLAYLISEYQLFGHNQINVIAHSFGSIIVLECQKILDKLYGTQKIYYINTIMLMGGMEDVQKLQKRRWNSVTGKIYNIYSTNDWVLRFVTKVIKSYENPCGIELKYLGLQHIRLGYKEVINIDATGFVEGHYDYKVKLNKILALSDFNNDLQYLLSGIKELF